MGVAHNPRIRKGLKADFGRTSLPQQSLVVVESNCGIVFELRGGFIRAQKPQGTQV